MVLNGKNSIFEQIVENYTRLITSGVLKNGEYLPSCRELAKELGINPNTVSKAYTMLEGDGYITVLPKKGAYVSFGNEKNDDNNSLKDSLNDLKKAGFTKEEVLKAIDDVFGVGEND